VNWFLLLGCLLCHLSGCSLIFPSTVPSSTSSLPPSYPLLAPATYGGSYNAQHLLEGQARGQDFSLQIHAEITPDHVLLLGFTPWQTRAFLLRYDGKTVEFENFTNRDLPFPPALILSDLQQAVWPNLPNRDGWQVIDDPHTHERRVFFHNQLVTHIMYRETLPTQSAIELVNVPLDYRLRIQIHQEKPGD
jgi:hypothetical protein